MPITALKDTHEGRKQLSFLGLVDLRCKDTTTPAQTDLKYVCKESPGNARGLVCNKIAVSSDSNVAEDNENATYDYAYQDTFFLTPETVAAIKSEANGSLQISSSREDGSPEEYNYAYDHTARHS